MDREREIYALELHRKHYNCCQAVVYAASETMKSEHRDLLFRAAEGFGKGMGNTEGICGALAGAVMMIGLAESNGDLESASSKHQTQSRASELMDRFKKEIGSIYCNEIRQSDTLSNKIRKLQLQGESSAISNCDRCIEYAVTLLTEGNKSGNS